MLNMKFNIHHLISAICTIALASSCLNFSPEAQVSDALVWDKADNFRLFANQFYSWTRDFRGSTTETWMNGVADGPHADTRSDIICQSTVNVYSSGSNSIPATDENYNGIYKKIYYTNLLLKQAAGFEAKDDIKEPVAEAYFFRAYLHFELVQMFGDCILLKEPLDIDSDRLYGKRDNRLDVINSCIQDLKDAAAMLNDTPSANGRLCKYTAYALLSRIALYEGTWQKYHNGNTEASNDLLQEAVNAADEVMKSKKYELFYDSRLGGGESYRYMFILENTKCNPAGLQKADNKEYILVRRHDEILSPIGYDITHGAQNNAYYVTKKMADMYRCQDGLPVGISDMFQGYTTQNSEFENRDNRMNGTLMKHGQPYWNNDGAWRTAWDDSDEENCLIADRCINSGYANYKWCTERQVTDDYEGYDYPVIRYAEVLLNYAEAVYELNGEISDEELDKSLNLVRLRSNPDMTKLSNRLVEEHAADGMTMIGEIRAERTVELFMEGFRIDDLKRWRTAEDEMPQDLLGLQITGTWYESNWKNQSRPLNQDGCIIMYTNRTWNDKNYLLPLPNDEIQLNPELGQNPEWN